jgi:arylsulfatase A-like enzyme
MPVLDRLVDDGTLFENAFSNAPFTHFSIPSFHTSRYIGNNAIGDRPTIASILSTEDITTCTIGTHTGSRSVNHGLGFDEYRDLGKEYYEQSGQLGDDHSKPIQWVKETLESYPVMFQIAKAAYDIPYYFTKTLSRSSDSDPLVYKSAETVTNRAINWIEQHDDEEIFLWIH